MRQMREDDQKLVESLQSRHSVITVPNKNRSINTRSAENNTVSPTVTKQPQKTETKSSLLNNEAAEDQELENEEERKGEDEKEDTNDNVDVLEVVIDTQP